MKYCSNCGTQMADDALFCTNCGTPVANGQTPNTTGSQQPNGNTNQQLDEETLRQGVVLCADGKYRWIYELNMWTNPSILFVVLKIFGWIFLGLFAFIFILQLFEGTSWSDIWGFFKGMLIFMAVFYVVILLGYALLALIYGGKYIVLFEMDDKEIIHRQMKSQFKKSEAIGWLTVMVGAMAGRPSTMGAGLLSATRSTMSSSFDSVRSVEPYKSRNLIKVNELLSKNQVYVHTEYFDFVYDYIRSHCPKLNK